MKSSRRYFRKLSEMKKNITLLMLMITLFSCVNLNNNFSINGVYIGRKRESSHYLELKQDSTFHYKKDLPCFPPFSTGRWYILSHNSILLVRDTSESKNPLLLLSEVFIDKKIKLKFKSNEKIRWKGADHKIHILYRKKA